MKKFLRVVASCIVALVAMSAQADWTALERAFGTRDDHDQIVAKVRASEEFNDETLSELIETFNTAAKGTKKEESFQALREYVSSKAVAERFAISKGANEKAKKIKSDIVYKSQKEATSSNWIQKLFDRLKKLLQDENSSSQEKQTMPDLRWMGPVVWGFFILLAVAIVSAIVYLIVKVPWAWSKAGRAKRSKITGMLEEGEELLSEDEYLIEADRLIAEGKFREASRALYLASLLRIDKSRIARFEPAQTNWEHLRRIESSKLRPEGLNFRPATKAFDMVWYGYRAKSADDVLIFRDTYLSIKHLTEIQP